MLLETNLFAVHSHLSKLTNEFKTHHSIASSRPSPLVAEVLNMDHVRLFSAERPSALDTSEADMAPSISFVIRKRNLTNEILQTFSELHTSLNILHFDQGLKSVALTCLLAKTTRIAFLSSSSCERQKKIMMKI